MLDPDEAAAVAALLEGLAVLNRGDPLSARALQAAALLRQRVAAGHGQGVPQRQGGLATRRETGDTRDDAADHRDVQATGRDRVADDRDDRAVKRDRQGDGADGEARTAEEHLTNLLGDAELRDKAAAEQAAAQLDASDDAGRQLSQADREVAEAGRDRNRGDRTAFRELLSHASAGRQAAWQGRYADGQDRLASRRDRRAAHADRQVAAADRQVARTDRDQAVIESEEADPPGTDVTGA